MSLEDWANINHWLEKIKSSPDQIRGHFSVADRCLDDLGKADKLSADTRLNLAHSAIMASATAVLSAAGYRVTRGGGEHYRTIEALEYTVDSKKQIVYTLDALRKKRNQSLYDFSGNVSEAEAKRLGEIAFNLRKDAEEWIHDNHPDLLK